MKQSNNTINLQKIMNQHQLKGVGGEEGKTAFLALSSYIDSNLQFNIFYVSISGVFFDASFAREAIVKLAKHYRLEKGVCLIDVEDEDIIDNILGPVHRLKQPIAYYFQDELMHVSSGKVGVPSKTNQKIFDYISKNGITSANDIAQHFDMKLNNASTKLKALYQEGFILRKEEKSETGGIEYLYYPIN